jgi:hypothetical protein
MLDIDFSDSDVVTNRCICTEDERLHIPPKRKVK